MSLKLFGVAAPVVLGGLYFAGALSGSYSRDIEQPPAKVMASLADLDIREQPGSPGTDPSRAGGIKPMFRTEQTANSMTWTVLAGDKVATRMTADFEPIHDGKGTRITAHVERGDAPDDFVSPAFRSTRLTMSLFSMALESELDELVAPNGWDQHCQDIMDHFAAGGFGAPHDQPKTLKGAMGETAQAVIKINALHGQLLSAGCNPEHGNDGGFHEVKSMMGPADPQMSSGQSGVSFEPGKPMVDVSRK